MKSFKPKRVHENEPAVADAVSNIPENAYRLSPMQRTVTESAEAESTATQSLTRGISSERGATSLERIMAGARIALRTLGFLTGAYFVYEGVTSYFAGQSYGAYGTGFEMLGAIEAVFGATLMLYSAFGRKKKAKMQNPLMQQPQDSAGTGSTDRIFIAGRWYVREGKGKEAPTTQPKAADVPVRSEAPASNAAQSPASASPESAIKPTATERPNPAKIIF